MMLNEQVALHEKRIADLETKAAVNLAAINSALALIGQLQEIVDKLIHTTQSGFKRL